MAGDCERSEAQGGGAVDTLVKIVVDGVLGVVRGVEMKIGFYSHRFLL
jgi:hypothetical protein